MRIVYVSPFRVDRGSAGLSRIIGNSLCLSNAGHEVTVIGQSGESIRREVGRGIAIEGRPAPMGRVARAFTGYGIEQALNEVAVGAQVMIVYGGNGPFTRTVRRWASSRRIPRIIDSVEWYEPSQVGGTVFSPRFLDNEYSMRVRYPQADGAIAISGFLERHYSSRGVPSVLLPPLLDVSQVPTGQKARMGPIQLVYAGTPGRKDSLRALVEAIRCVDGTGRRLALDIYGPHADDPALNGLRLDRDQGDGVVLRGLVERRAVLEAVAGADYIPMFRPDRRFAHAGFPTKLVEAMAAGTGILGNLTSDLGAHVSDGITGIVVANDSFESMVEGLKRAIDGGHEQAKSLGEASRGHAEGAFHFGAHSKRLDEWVTSIAHSWRTDGG